MVLYWLREHPKYRVLAHKFNISTATCWKEIQFILPKILNSVHGEIAWSPDLQATWEGVSGAVDCTAHPRTRVHPRQADYYRFTSISFCE